MEEHPGLKVLDKIKGIFTYLGIDYLKLRRILQFKLMVLERSSKEKKGWLYYGGYFIMNLFIAGPLFWERALFFRLFFSFSVLMFFIVRTLVANFSLLFADIRDREEFMARPVSLKLLSLARALKVVIYLGKEVGVLSLGLLVFGTVNEGGLFLPIMFFSLLLVLVFLVFFLLLGYAVFLKLFSAQQIEQITTYFQIGAVSGASIFFYYLFLVRDISFLELAQEVSAVLGAWVYFLPPAWYSAPFELLLNNNWQDIYIRLGLLALLMPLLVVYLSQRLTGGFIEQKLGQLAVGRTKTTKFGELKRSLKSRIAGLLTGSFQEKSLFKFSHAMLVSDREFKSFIYPKLVEAVVFPLMIWLGQLDFDNLWFSMRQSASDERFFIYLFYFFMVWAATIFYRLSQTKYYQASWIYRVLPIEDPNLICKGALKALLVRYKAIPILVLGVLWLGVARLTVLLDVGMVKANLVLAILVLVRETNFKLPFAYDLDFEDAGASIFYSILSFMVVVSLAAVHFVIRIYFSRWWLLAYLLLTLGVIKKLWKQDFGCQWKTEI